MAHGWLPKSQNHNQEGRENRDDEVQKVMSESDRLRCNSIDIGGLDNHDQQRIEEISFSAWLDEIASKPRPVSNSQGELSKEAVEYKSRQGRLQQRCSVCHRTFLSKRADASACSPRCRQRENRRRKHEGTGSQSGCHRSQEEVKSRVEN